MRNRSAVRVQRRLFSDKTYGQGHFGWSGNKEGVGRKVFHKGWRHLTPRRPVDLQERWHRASVERLMNPAIIEQLKVELKGKRDTLDWRMYFKTTALDMSSTATEDLKRLSPWHDIPMGFIDTKRDALLFNFVNEIPKGERAKMECATDEDWNPIKQDVKKGALRYFKYGDLPFNYGFIPQTWEDPNLGAKHSDVAGLGGDNDPVDVVEISNEALPMGKVIPSRVLGVIGLIDEGETDWKIIALRADHPRAQKIQTIADAESELGVDFEAMIVEWFRNYKVPDGKPLNEFTHNAKTQSPEMAVEVIEECHQQWYNFMLGATKSDLSRESAMYRHICASGLTSDSKMEPFPRIDYPKFEDWSTSAMDRVEEVDDAYEEYELDEEAPDQRRR